jgi:predicted membrane chloride channel (bestrophin family)
MKRLTEIRAEYFSIGDFEAGRMPVAYVQLVQILVDSLVWLSPFSLYSGLGSLSIPLCGLLTLFFKGLLELSKSFLDPFGNEGFPDQNIRVDVLVSELNFGAASRWFQAANHLPVRNTKESKIE